MVIVFYNPFGQPIPKYLTDEFTGPRVIVESASAPKYPLLKRKFYRIFCYLSDFLVYDYSNRLIRRVRNNDNVVWFQLKRLFLQLSSRLNFLKKFIRFIDQFFFTSHFYTFLFDKYRPDIVFSTSIISSFDLEFLREARHRGLKTIAMPRGWDNVNTKLYRHAPDLLIVQNPEMRQQAIRIQNFPAARVKVTGFPQFDWYRRPNILLTREEFCRRTGLDPKRKIIFWGSSGRWTPVDGNIAQTIIAAVRSNKLIAPTNLIIRPHFSDLATRRFDHLADGKTVFVDKNYTPSNFFWDGWDPNVTETIMFTNTIYHADVIISLCSTLVLDVLCFDKPIINTAYKSFYDAHGHDVSHLLYSPTVYAPVLAEKAVDLVKSETELITSLNHYLRTPDYKHDNRLRARDRMCYQIDGQASQRIVDALMSLL